MSEDHAYLQFKHRSRPVTSYRRRHANNYYLMGRDHADAGALDEARRLLLLALQQDTDHIPALRVLAGIEFSQGNLPAARQRLAQVLALDPQDIDSLYLLGHMAMSSHDPAAALQAYRRAADAGEHSPELAYFIGQAHLGLGHGAEASTVFTALLEEWPDHLRGWDGLGCARRLEKDYYGASSAFLRALQIDPSYNDARDHLAQMLMETGNATRAQLVLEAALSLEPGRVSSRHLLGVAYASDGRFSEAASCWEELLEQGNALPETYHLLANAYLHLEDRGRARELLTALLAQHPDHLAGRLQLALLLLEEGEYVEGWEHLEQARRLNPQHPTVAHAVEAAAALIPHPVGTEGG